MSEQDNLKIHEAQERAELAHSDRTLAPVTLTMALLAVPGGYSLDVGSSCAQWGAACANPGENRWNSLMLLRSNIQGKRRLAVYEKYE